MKEDVEKAVTQLKKLIHDLNDVSLKEKEEKTRQLEVVEHAISNLEKATISVPPELKNLKSKLVIHLEKMKGSSEIFDYLADELKALLDTITEVKSSLAVPKSSKFPKVIFDDDMVGIRPSARAGNRR